ncbi:tetratricopeptide repeat protein [Candidatus Villigracilis affinis]|uniref:lytic transglycosylase domain-containing protein n=1 Tax=Candidatus Villigracilis affinis TaxID=3140682 RepID=UPI002A20F4D4|nr:tetratricopeptide repeat protein [Anaerolineales bacterium]
MKFIHPSTNLRRSSLRVFLGLWLATAITACSILPGFPTIPPGWTLTPNVTSTPEATSTPTITPTPLPIARVDKGDIALFNGDYENALIHYKTALTDSPDPLVQAAAKWGEARVYFAEERYEETLASTQALITGFPQSINLGQAYFLQGLANYRLGNYQAAADAWQSYLVVRPGHLDAYVQELRGDALYGALDYPSALSAYTAAIQAPALGDDITLDLKVASTQVSMGDYNSALALYDGIAARAPNDYIKAQVAYESGLAYQAIGQSEEALNRFRLAVEQYPLSYYSYLSLVALLDAGGTVNQLDRGLVDYFAGQYDVAVAAFNQYLVENPTNDGTAYYYRAQSHRDLGNYDAALLDYSKFITDYPTHPRWVDAWGEKAFIEWYNLGSYNVGIKTLLDFVAAVPSSEISADYLMSAARIYERNGKYEEAIQIWARVANEYPGSEQASTATFLTGIIHYRNGNTVPALDAFNRSLTLSMLAVDQARAYLWMGKAQLQLGDGEAAVNAWRAAQDRDPAGYYSERARDLLLERQPFQAPISVNLAPNLESERKDADSWIRLTFNLPLETDLNGLGPLASDQRVIRGTELMELGIYEDARLEFENLRAELETNMDAVGSYRLMNYLLDIGLYRSAIFTGRQVLTIAGLDEHTESMMAPPYFGHVRYGLYYADLVLPDAEANRFDPLFIFSVIRQESLFEGFVKSSAGARGLMQVIPSTGGQIVSQLGWPVNYSDEDLYRPDVSIAFGTHYLGNNRDLLGGDLYAALAAYNGGPGNAIEWKELSNGDPDLFLESVRFEETRNYIRSIYEIYTIYRRLYGLSE